MIALENAAEQYLHRVSDALPCDRREKARYLQDLRVSLERYAQEHPGASMTQLQAHFGTPEQIAEDYLNANPLVISRELSHRRRFRKAAVVLAVCAVALLAVIGGMTYHAYQNSRSVKDGYVIEAIQEEEPADAFLDELFTSREVH